MAIAKWTCVSWGWVVYAPGTIAVNVTWIEREFNACQTPRSMCPYIFNHFWDIYISVASDWFSTVLMSERAFFNHILLSPGYAPVTITVSLHGSKENSMLVKRITACTHLSSTISEIQRYIGGERLVFVSEWAFFYHNLLSPGYAPGTIAVNVTRLERGFNTCKTPRCIYPSIFNRFWDIASYWSVSYTHLTLPTIYSV